MPSARRTAMFTSGRSTRLPWNASTLRSSRQRSAVSSARISSAKVSISMIKVKLGAGAFVCGEETALIASIEGKRGQPRAKPPFPVQKGLWGYPTIINNVETLANVPYIMRKGAAWYAAMGTEKSKGTKVFALTGKILNSGPYRSADGHPAQGGHLRYRRRHRGRQKAQGGPDRRSVGRVHSLQHHRHARWITNRSARSARSWAPAAWWCWTRPTAW